MTLSASRIGTLNRRLERRLDEHPPIGLESGDLDGTSSSPRTPDTSSRRDRMANGRDKT
jgi:hypothetical protein